MRALPVLLALLGAALIVAAAWLVYVPAGLAVAGGFLLAAGLLIDFGGAR